MRVWRQIFTLEISGLFSCCYHISLFQGWRLGQQRSRILKVCQHGKQKHKTAQAEKSALASTHLRQPKETTLPSAEATACLQILAPAETSGLGQPLPTHRGTAVQRLSSVRNTPRITAGPSFCTVGGHPFKVTFTSPKQKTVGQSSITSKTSVQKEYLKKKKIQIYMP